MPAGLRMILQEKSSWNCTTVGSQVPRRLGKEKCYNTPTRAVLITITPPLGGVLLLNHDYLVLARLIIYSACAILKMAIVTFFLLYVYFYLAGVALSSHFRGAVIQWRSMNPYNGTVSSSLDSIVISVSYSLCTLLNLTLLCCVEFYYAIFVCIIEFQILIHTLYW